MKRFVLPLCGLLVLSPAALPAADVTVVYTDNAQVDPSYWRPLPEADMARVVADAALAELSRDPRLRVIRAANAARSGNLQVRVTPAGQSQSVSVMLELYSPATGNVSASANASLAGLGSAELRDALAHLGGEAGGRLAAQVSAALNGGTATASSGFELQQQFEAAMNLKRGGSYHEAHAAFQRVAQQRGADAGHWPELARDELRYGLPMFRAQQVLNESMLGADSATLQSALSEAENLLRQVAAENADNAGRVREAHALLDRLQITRSTLRNAMQASAAAQTGGFRMMLSEYALSEGTCPDAKQVRELENSLPQGMQVRRVTGLGKLRRYYLADVASGYETVLECDATRQMNPVRNVN